MLQPPCRIKWHGTPGFISWPWIVPAIQPSQHAVQVAHSRCFAVDDATAGGAIGMTMPQHFLYLWPLPQGQGSFLPGLQPKKRNTLIEMTPPEPMPALFPCAAQNNMMLSRTQAALAAAPL